MGGFLLGEPEVWDPSIDIKKCDGYFLTIKVTKVARNLRFPILCLKTAEGGNHWTNQLVGKEVDVNRFNLEDAVEFQGIEYEILKGYVFRNGRNNQIAETIKSLFDERRKLKEEKDENGVKVGNPLQLCIKLCLNSCYGITGLKTIETDVVYKSKKDLEPFLRANYNLIRSFTKLGDNEGECRQYRIEVNKGIEKHYNRVPTSRLKSCLSQSAS